MAKHIEQKWYSFHAPIHSDNLVHWTGRDIMSKYARLSKKDILSTNIDSDELWQELQSNGFIDRGGRKLQKALEINTPDNIGLNVEKNKVAFEALKSVHFFANDKQYPPDVVNEFLQRLKNILLYGLWMTKHRGDVDYINTKEGKFPKPKVSRVCFTELKVSDSLLHADNFGPMGIGFKRLFLANRFGSPVYYVPECGYHPIISTGSSWYNPDNKLLKDITPDEVDEHFAFFKDMSSGRCSQGYISYDLYDESEWRIIFSEKLKKRLSTKELNRKLKYFIDPEDPSCEKKYKDFYASLGDNYKPDYLVPIDEWLSLIIYPNLQIKNASIKDAEIRHLLTCLKCEDKKNVLAEGIPRTEISNFPIEVDFGSLKNV